MKPSEFQKLFEEFIEYPVTEWEKWFGDIGTVLQVKKFLKEDLYYYLANIDVEAEATADDWLYGFLFSKNIRVLSWFQRDTDLDMQFTYVLIDDFKKFNNERLRRKNS